MFPQQILSTFTSSFGTENTLAFRIWRPSCAVSPWSIVSSASFVNGVSHKEVSLLSHCCSMRVENESLMQASVVRGSVCTDYARNGTFRLKIRHRTMPGCLQDFHSCHATENHRYHPRSPFDVQIHYFQSRGMMNYFSLSLLPPRGLRKLDK